MSAPIYTPIDLGSLKRLTVDPHPRRPGLAVVHLWIDGMAGGFFEIGPKEAAQLVGQLMDAFAATTVKS